ncbi:MAG TPA: malonic semialdehyde reductase [Gammaproteobacteria bacterium]|nr:malonic semialdehyde reductase [Gammaproteobacteria bacterium]HRY10994.1 malonic semialdehyde reductase [Candidatus Nanopelagicales bacterium]
MTTTSITVDPLFAQAHTAYSFGPQPVSDTELAAIYETVKWAPTAMNSQPLRVAYVRSPDAKADLEPHLARGNVEKMRSAPVTAILAFDSDWHEHLPALQPFATDPHLAWQDRDQRESMARFNASLQAGYFILSVRAHGLVAGPMGGFDKAGMDATFFPDGRWRSLLLVNIGHPGPESFKPRMPRLEFDQATVLL